jgi:prevent-host-death family protein
MSIISDHYGQKGAGAMGSWQVQEAKSRLSEVIERARSEGPQTITKHGKPTAVVLSPEAYQTLQRRKSRPNLVDFLLTSGPKFDEFEIERDRDTGREVDLE